ncbi:MAG: cyclopropane-fatty-acyl-phospholipid synthase family protein [Planctomycetes bacterium]|nr:cyclopropane-fatty-acyl-phospholipid synthase family protein [Planctomycetota bacterium]
MKSPLETPNARGSAAVRAPTRAFGVKSEGFAVRLARRAVFARLARIAEGELTIVEGGTRTDFGRRGTGPRATLHVHDAETWRAVAALGSVGAGEAYIQGRWSSDDLVALARLFVRNREALDSLERGFARLGQWLIGMTHRSRANTVDGSKRNIVAHYDLSNQFYELFLDRSMTYSSALFESEDESLELAQERKLERLCRELDLKPGERLLEIGTGWGGLALHAARHYGVHVTTTTISRAQHDYAVERVRRAGLESRISVLERDYRELDGRFDKLVSVEMIEAVGHAFLDGYFAKVSALLEPHGRAALQAIVIRDALHAQSLRAVDFIQHFVFPGSQLPSRGSIAAAVARSTDLQEVSALDFSPSYATTLALWRERFRAELARVRRLGFSDEFTRLWDFYLAYCEAGFREHSIGVVQLVYAKPRGWKERV